ncbi:MAG: WbqC family protein [Bacteroidetes bacterium]|nr:WbqC family protein [Bacteroidota bacterium]
MSQPILKTDLQYFGSIHFVKTLMENRNVVFDLEAPFTKMSFKNRMVIVTSQGPLMLTIPIVGGRDQKTPIKDITIAYDTPWTAQHLKSLTTSYKRAPYFEYYEQSLQVLYANKPAKLVDFLLLCSDWLQIQLKLNWNFNQTQEEVDLDAIVKYYDPWLPKNYNQHNGLPKYQQVFSDQIDFVANLSILDMLFCVGGREISKLWAPPIK